jgi:hypothetical protein
VTSMVRPGYKMRVMVERANEKIPRAGRLHGPFEAKGFTDHKGVSRLASPRPVAVAGISMNKRLASAPIARIHRRLNLAGVRNMFMR